MISDHIEKVKREYTDKYVVVDGARPELARFRDLVGQVKTVNMSGRALVEFMDYHLNIGWYDIDLDYLKVVDKPPPTEKKPAAKKPAPKKSPAPVEGQKKLSPLEMARMQGAAKKKDTSSAKTAAGKQSTADILAAARGGSKPATPKEKPASTSSGGKTSTGKMSTADILAAARGDKPEADGPPGQTTKESIALEDEAVAESSPAVETAAGKEGSVVTEKVDRSAMSVTDMIAWCRAHDAS